MLKSSIFWVIYHVYFLVPSSSCLIINHEYPLMYLKEDFEEYAQEAKTLPAGTSNDNKLALYGLYKQATVGPVNTGNVYLAN